MKRRLITSIFVLVFPLLALAGDTSAVQRTYREIEATLGAVPSFLRLFPEEGLPGAWEALKTVQLNPNTALSPFEKELIALGVAAQIPCEYCTYFHRRAATLAGAGDRELREAIAIAAITRQWSTILNGNLTDETAFRREADKIFANAKKPAPRAAAQPVRVVDAESAYRDIEQTLGLVPRFLRQFPASGIAGAWSAMKAVQLNPATALTGRQKELIGLGVAAQIPCRYCIYFHTEAAKLHGATEQQVAEALAMAALVRHWSTVLNGNLVDRAEWRREVDAVIGYVSRATK